MADSTPTAAVVENQWPSVEVAYDFVMPSYQMLISRFESADTRLTSLLTLASSLTLGAPILAKAVRQNISFTSPLFLVGLSLFILGAVLGVVGRVKGRITLPDPMVFHQTALHESTWTFKKNAVYFAGLAFKSNADAVRRKGNMALAVTVALLLEIVCFVAWLGIG
jgi:hypothetical protein